MTTKSTIRAAMGCAIGFSFLVVGASARAGDDDQDVPFESKIIGNFLEGLGLKRDGAGAIDYQERPPLVIPPSRDLPPPERTDAAVRNPAWPKDPDVARAKAEVRRDENRDVQAEIERDGKPLSPKELTPGPKPRSPQRKATVSSGPGLERSTPSELGYTGNLFNMFGSKNESVGFTGEPPRASLTDPPPGYRTPSPDQPYGLNKAPPPKAGDYYSEHGETHSDR